MIDLLPDALADALGDVVADVRRECRREIDVVSAESRVITAELRLEVFTLKAALKESADQQSARVADAISGIKNGEAGKNADPQVAAEIATKLVSDELTGIIRADVAAIHSGIEEMGAGFDRKIAEHVAAAVARLPAAETGKSVDPEEVRLLVITEVEDVLKARPVPADGHTPTVEEMAPVIVAAVRSAVDALPRPKDGEDGTTVDPEEVRAFVIAEVETVIEELAPVIEGKIAERVMTAVDALPVPKDGEDGKSADPEEVERLIAGLVDNAVAKLPPAEPGKNADPEEVRAIIADLVQEAVAQLPRPEPGKSITPADVADMIAAEVSMAVASVPAPKDGESVDLAEVERMVASEVGTAVERALAANDDCVPDELAETVSSAIRALAESPAPTMAAAVPPLVLNVAAGAALDRRPTRKTITTRRDEAGNLIADVVEHY